MILITVVSGSVNYFRNKTSESAPDANPRILSQLKVFRENLLAGIAYYKTLFGTLKERNSVKMEQLNHEMDTIANDLKNIRLF